MLCLITILHVGVTVASILGSETQRLKLGLSYRESHIMVVQGRIWVHGNRDDELGVTVPKFSGGGLQSLDGRLGWGLGTETDRSDEMKPTVWFLTSQGSSAPLWLPPPPLHPQAISWPPGEITAGAFKPALRRKPSSLSALAELNASRAMAPSVGGWAGGQGQGKMPLTAPPRDISRPACPFQPLAK